MLRDSDLKTARAWGYKRTCDDAVRTTSRRHLGAQGMAPWYDSSGSAVGWSR